MGFNHVMETTLVVDYLRFSQTVTQTTLNTEGKKKKNPPFDGRFSCALITQVMENTDKQTNAL